MVLVPVSCDPCCSSWAFILIKFPQTLFHTEVQEQKNAPLTIFEALPHLPSEQGLQQVLLEFSSYVAFSFFNAWLPKRSRRAQQSRLDFQSLNWV